MIRLLAPLLFALGLCAADAQTLGPPGPASSAAITSLTGDCTATGPGAALATCPGRNYLPNTYYRPYGIQITSLTAAAPGANRIVCSPGAITRKLTFNAVAANVTTASSGGNFQWGVYTDSGGRPGTLIASTGSGSTTSTGAVAASVSGPGGITSAQIGPGTTPGGYLWFCANSDNATVVYASATIVGGLGGSLIGSATALNTLSTSAEIGGLSCSAAACAGGASTFGTWPSTLAGTTWSDYVVRATPAPAIFVNSVP